MKKARLPLMVSFGLSYLLAAQTFDAIFKIVGVHGDKSATSKESISKQSSLTIFKKGYWIPPVYGNPQNPLGDGDVGSYKLTNGKYVETLDYYSWDNKAVEDEYTSTHFSK